MLFDTFRTHLQGVGEPFIRPQLLNPVLMLTLAQFIQPLTSDFKIVLDQGTIRRQRNCFLAICGGLKEGRLCFARFVVL